MDNGSRLIELVQGKGVAVVDESDYGRLSQYRWYIKKNKNVSYAQRFEYYKVQIGERIETKGKPIMMHNDIMSTPSGMYVDHKDGDGLNNIRSNMRICTKGQNARNLNLPSRGRYGFYGIYLNNRTEGQYASKLYFEGKSYWLGVYATPEEAAEAYDSASRYLRGDEFLILNFPSKTIEPREPSEILASSRGPYRWRPRGTV